LCEKWLGEGDSSTPWMYYLMLRISVVER